MSLSNPSSQGSGNSLEGRRKSVRVKRTRPTKLTRSEFIGAHRLRDHVQGLFAPGPWHMCYCLQFAVFCGIPLFVNEWISGSWACFYGFLLLFILSNSNVKVLFYLVIFYFIVFYYHTLEDCFLMRDRKENYSGWEGRCGPGGCRGMGNCNHDILCEEKILF